LARVRILGGESSEHHPNVELDLIGQVLFVEAAQCHLQLPGAASADRQRPEHLPGGLAQSIDDCRQIC
jgi:hypothetical protein